MVAGQTADMLAEQQKATPEHLDFIEVNKTGQLITAGASGRCPGCGGTRRRDSVHETGGKGYGQGLSDPR